MREICLILLLTIGSVAANQRPKRQSGFGCTNANPMTDQLRQMFLNAHNEARASMAKGLEPGFCGNLTSGSNVYQLNYNCQLEQQIYTACSSGGGYCNKWGASSMWSDPANVQQYTLSTVQGWWDQARTTPNLLDANNVLTASSAFSWKKMAVGEASEMGCVAFVSASNQLVVGCSYDSAGSTPAVYEKGPPCSADADCTTYAGSTCLANGLCKRPPHTDSGANTQCANNPDMNDAARDMFVEMHNHLRQKGVKGKAADFFGGFAPTGSASYEITYNCSVEASMQSWMSSCQYGHSPNTYRPNLGENLMQTSDTAYPMQFVAQYASQLWWSELVQYGVGQPNILNDTFWQKVGHYSQMAWGDTFQIGCGIKRCPTITYVGCEYYTGGNYLNSLIYKLGTPCSAASNTCPSGQACSTKYPGLCVHP